MTEYTDILTNENEPDTEIPDLAEEPTEALAEEIEEELTEEIAKKSRPKSLSHRCTLPGGASASQAPSLSRLSIRSMILSSGHCARLWMHIRALP